MHATRAAAWLIQREGWNVFSPITHSHPLATIGDLRSDWPFWKKIDTEYLECSERLVVLEITGWRESTGVQEEIKIALKMGLPVFSMVERGIEEYLLVPWVKSDTKETANVTT